MNEGSLAFLSRHPKDRLQLLFGLIDIKFGMGCEGIQHGMIKLRKWHQALPSERMDVCHGIHECSFPMSFDVLGKVYKTATEPQ